MTHRRSRVRAGIALAAALATLAAVLAVLATHPALAAAADTPTWQLDHYTKVGYVRSFKLDLIRELPEPPQLVTFGGSRTTRFEPSLLRRLTGLPAFNCAVSNCEPEDVWAFTNHLFARSPDTKVRCLWGLQVRGIIDVTFGQGLVYDQRLSRWFPPELIAEQKERIGTPVIKDLLNLNVFTARGMLRWCLYDRQRERGLTLSESLDKWIPLHVAKEQSGAVTPQERARAYFEATLSLYNEHGVTPCIVIMPFHPRALRALQAIPEWQARFAELKSYLQGLQATYSLHVLNYTLISKFGGRSSWFYDGAHITVENARLLLRQAVADAPECFQ
jgi:hypothetical protein